MTLSVRLDASTALDGYAAGATAQGTSFVNDPRWLAAVHARPDQESSFAVAMFVDGVKAGNLLLEEGRAAGGVRQLSSVQRDEIDLTDMPLVSEGASAAVFRGVLGALARMRPWDLLRFPLVRSRSSLITSLPECGYRYALTDGGGSAYCDVTSADALRSISKEHLRNVERHRRRAQRDMGPIAFEAITDSSIATTAFDRFVALEDAGWKGASGTGTSLASDVLAQDFFRDVARRFQRDGSARIDFLTIAGRDAAAQLAVRAGPTWFLLKIGYHPDFKDVGPGGILLKAFLEEMRDTPNILEVNLTTNPPWAARWHFQTEPVFHVYIYNTTWRGGLLYAARSVKDLAKALRNRYRALRAPAPSK